MTKERWNYIVITHDINCYETNRAFKLWKLAIADFGFEIFEQLRDDRKRKEQQNEILTRNAH